jgi:hypothetical protein
MQGKRIYLGLGQSDLIPVPILPVLMTQENIPIIYGRSRVTREIRVLLLFHTIAL